LFLLLTNSLSQETLNSEYIYLINPDMAELLLEKAMYVKEPLCGSSLLTLCFPLPHLRGIEVHHIGLGFTLKLPRINSYINFFKNLSFAPNVFSLSTIQTAKSKPYVMLSSGV
jgi:hypothetical protein